MNATTHIQIALTALILATLLGVSTGCDSSDDESSFTEPWGLYSVQTNGNELERLTGTEFQENHVQVSPDGNRLVTTRFRQDLNGDGRMDEGDVESSEIAIRDLSDDTVTIVSDESLTRVIDYGGVWSPDGTRIAMASNRGQGAGGTLDIYTTAVDGSDVVNITNTPTLNEWDPHWEDGYITYNRMNPFDPDAQPGIWVYNTETGQERQVTAPSIPDDGSGAILGDMDPKISPDLNWILITRKLDGTSNHGNGQFDLIRVPFEGGPERNLTPTPEAELLGQWSPNGSQIVFWVIHNDVDANQSLQIMMMDGGQRREIAHRSTSRLWEEMPNFARPASPQRIYFTAVDSTALSASPLRQARPRTDRKRYRYPVGFERER